MAPYKTTVEISENNGKLRFYFVGKAEKTENGYTAEFVFEKKYIMTHGDKIYFNAYRLEIDCGEMDKHLFALSPTMKPKFHVPSYFLWLDDYIK